MILYRRRRVVIPKTRRVWRHSLRTAAKNMTASVEMFGHEADVCMVRWRKGKALEVFVREPTRTLRVLRWLLQLARKIRRATRRKPAR